MFDELNVKDAITFGFSGLALLLSFLAYRHTRKQYKIVIAADLNSDPDEEELIIYNKSPRAIVVSFCEIYSANFRWLSKKQYLSDFENYFELREIASFSKTVLIFSDGNRLGRGKYKHRYARIRIYKDYYTIKLR